MLLKLIGISNGRFVQFSPCAFTSLSHFVFCAEQSIRYRPNSRAKIVLGILRIEGKVLRRITHFLLSHWKKSSAQRRLLQIPIRPPNVIASNLLIPVYNIISSSHHFCWFERCWNILTLSCPNLPLSVFVLSFREMGRGKKGLCVTRGYETGNIMAFRYISGHPLICMSVFWPFSLGLCACHQISRNKNTVTERERKWERESNGWTVCNNTSRGDITFLYLISNPHLILIWGFLWEVKVLYTGSDPPLHSREVV